jgi:uncharacterized protein with PQ loop repeat
VVLAVLGWVAVVMSATMGLPQLVRLARTRNVEGLSLTAWRLILTMNLIWAVHGGLLHQLPMVLTNSLALFTTVPILVLLTREHERRLVWTVAPSLALAAGMIAVDAGLGSAAFGVVSTILAVSASAGQSIALIRSPHVRGVSTPFTVLSVGYQSLWVVWGLIAHDAATIMAASTMLALASFNLLWFVLRRLGLRAFFATSPEPEPAASLS